MAAVLLVHLCSTVTFPLLFVADRLSLLTVATICRRLVLDLQQSAQILEAKEGGQGALIGNRADGLSNGSEKLFKLNGLVSTHRLNSPR